MNDVNYHPLLHRIAIATALLALLPIVVGALVTTMDAGMAFPDWPSSDGHNMFAYPWLQSAGDKFLEHGHRLAGALVGLASIALVVAVWKLERRTWVRVAAVGVLLSVIAQGILGGQRVLFDARRLAMLHGILAALVFALMATVALGTSRGWISRRDVADGKSPQRFGALKPLAIATPGFLFAQYLLGGMVRHLGTALHEHVLLAVLVVCMVMMTSVVALRLTGTHLRRHAKAMLGLVILQVVLGVGSWATKFGLASLGYVAVHHSPVQIAMRTSHTVVGMLLFATSVLFAIRVIRADRLLKTTVGTETTIPRVTSSFSVEGGLR